MQVCCALCCILSNKSDIVVDFFLYLSCSVADVQKKMLKRMKTASITLKPCALKRKLPASSLWWSSRDSQVSLALKMESNRVELLCFTAFFFLFVFIHMEIGTYDMWSAIEVSSSPLTSSAFPVLIANTHLKNSSLRKQKNVKGYRHLH